MGSFPETYNDPISGCAQTDAKTPNIVTPKMLGVVACVLAVVYGCNNSQQCWDLQCIVGRILPISLCKQCVMSVRGPNNVGRAVQTDATCNNQQCCVRLHRASPQLPPTNCRPFNPQYLHTNSPNWCLYISIKNKLREFDKRLKHFLPADYFINSHKLFT